MGSWVRFISATLTILTITMTIAAPVRAQNFTPEQAQNRNTARMLLDKSSVCMNAGDFASAADILQQAVQSDESYSRTHANLGWALMKLGRNDQAVIELRKATSLEPDLVA